MADRGVRGLAKRVMQAGVRTAHVWFMRRPLPRRVALYFHELDEPCIRALEEVVGWLRGMDYRVVSAREYDEGGDAREKLLFVSFDDNYSTWHQQRGRLAKLGVRAMFYVNTEPLDCAAADPVAVAYYDRLGQQADRCPLTSGQLADLVADGHELGCHTHTHPNLGQLPVAAALDELRLNRDILAKFIGKLPVDMSFPFGMPRNFPAGLETAARDLGFTRIAHATPAMLHAPHRQGTVHRAFWKRGYPLRENALGLVVDGSRFVKATGCSPIG